MSLMSSLELTLGLIAAMVQGVIIAGSLIVVISIAKETFHHGKCH